MSFNPKKSGLALLGVTLIICVALTINYMQMWKDDFIIPGPGVTQVKWLSDYVPELKGTLGDTRVFIMDSGRPGGTFLIIGGTHGDEPAGWCTALVVVENAVVKEGRVIVVPQYSNTGFTHNYPQEAHAQFIHLTTADGSVRTFRHGSRTGNSAEHWPDPEVFIQYPSKQKYSGEEARNPNRSYPGRLDGTFAERVSYAIQQLIRAEHVEMQIDLHEGQPEYPFINALSGQKRAQDLVTLAQMELQDYDIAIGAEVSPDAFRGLSNLEMGDMFPDLYAMTSETVNPNQGKIRGITDENLPVDGVDAFYDKAAELGYLFAPWKAGEGSPLKLRVARDIQELAALCNAFTEVTGKPISWAHLPTAADVLEHGVGYYLNPVPADGIPDPGYRAFPGFWRLFSQVNW